MITLKTLPEATEQQVFDQIAKHLLSQKQRSTNGEMCRYRGPDGLKCAAGCLMTDDEYDCDRMEGAAWIDCTIFPAAHVGIIQYLQDLHDTREPEDWPRFLRRAAIDYGLNPKVIDDHT